MWTLAKLYAPRLALANLTRNRRMIFPYFIAAALMSAMYFIITNLLLAKSIQNMSHGATTQSMLMIGQYLMTLFIVGYMFYINSFLMKRRKKEFGLYGVLGLEKRHVARIILLESLYLNLAALALGLAIGLCLRQALLPRADARDPRGGGQRLPAGAGRPYRDLRRLLRRLRPDDRL